MISYRVRVFIRDHEGASHHDAEDMEEELNKHAAEGYVLTHALKVSSGYILVLGRDA